MYNILLADDELPSLRFLETIITKYTTDFQVINKLRDGVSALEWLRNHLDSVDLLITDIRMPDMDGITLAKAARRLKPDLHIVIVSGYSEFEYAHGAIEASVDDYILKPVSLTHMKDLLSRIRLQLDNSSESKVFDDLSALIRGGSPEMSVINRVFGKAEYFTALLRYGNVLYPKVSFRNTSLAGVLPFDGPMVMPDLDAASGAAGFITTPEPRHLYILRGRDGKEFLLLACASGSVIGFQDAVRQLAKESEGSMSTVVFGQSGIPMEQIGTFYEQASKLLRHTAVLGHYHEAVLNAPGETAASNSVNISPTVLKRLQLCVRENNQKDILHIFQSLGKEWDEKEISQRQAYVMMQQLLHLVETTRRDHWKDTDVIMTEADALTNTASSCCELLESLFHVLYDSEHTDLKQGSPEDMYHYAILTIHKKFNQPISIQTVCSEIGISQTYLSRLFRKYGNTSFNAYLIQCRMENARTMLEKQPDMPLHQVAVSVGYDDYAYFSKVFRQTIGMSPSQFQASLRTQDN